jgi:hypothetical protein
LNFAAIHMRKTPAYFFLTIIIVLAALSVARQRTIHSLRADNSSLRMEVDARRNARRAVVPETQEEPVAALSEADEKDLLQLRSRIGLLREQLCSISNRVVLLQRLPTNPNH